jgi:SPP1 family predicted phage head-tail adaptor
MRSGRLSKRISIESRNTTKTASGTPNGGWVQFVSVRASVVEKAGKENYEGDQNVARTTHEVRIRYCEGIKRSMRVVWNGRILNIHGFTVDDKNREIVMHCEERVQ